MKKTFIACLMVVFISAGLRAEDPITARSLRALGMGNTFNACGDDPAVLFYNPAGLSSVKRLRISTKPLMVSGNNFFGALYSLVSDQEISQLFSGAKAWTDLSQDAKNKILQTYVISGEASVLNPTVLIPTDTLLGSIGVGYYTLGSMEGMLDPGIIVPNVSIAARLDSILAFGISQKLEKYIGAIPGSLSAGLSVKTLQRKKLEGFFSLLSVSSNTFTDITSNGTAANVCLGGIYQLPGMENLKFACTVNDLGGTTVRYDNGTTGVIKQSLNAGVAWSPRKPTLRGLETLDDLMVTADLDNVFSGQDVFKNLHLGVEYKLPLLATVRAGLNAGWICLGAKVLGLLEVAYYKEERGSVPGTLPSERFYFNLSVGF